MFTKDNTPNMLLLNTVKGKIFYLLNSNLILSNKKIPEEIKEIFIIFLEIINTKLETSDKKYSIARNINNILIEYKDKIFIK